MVRRPVAGGSERVVRSLSLPPARTSLAPGQLVELPRVQPDGIGPPRDGPLDRLANPPDGISRQPRLVDDVEPVDGHQEGAEAFLDQVAGGYAPVVVSLGDVGHQPHVRHGQLGPDLLIPPRQRPEFLGRRIEPGFFGARKVADQLLEIVLGGGLVARPRRRSGPGRRGCASCNRPARPRACVPRPGSRPVASEQLSSPCQKISLFCML